MSGAREAGEALKSFLESLGFSVEVGGSLRGVSGIAHVFDLVAVRGDTVLCFDFAEAGENLVLRAMAKTIDIRRAKIFLLLDQSYAGSGLESLEGGGRLSVVFFESVEDLLEKISSAVAETDPIACYR